MIILLLFSEVKTALDFDYYSNRCDQFTGQLPDTFLDQCPNAEFMTGEDYECYDRAYKKE